MLLALVGIFHCDGEIIYCLFYLSVNDFIVECTILHHFPTREAQVLNFPAKCALCSYLGSIDV